MWGAETWLCNTEEYCGKILHLHRGYRCSMHYHKIKDEVFYIISGLVFMEVDGQEYHMQAGDAIRVKPGIKHRFTGLTSAKILEISTTHMEDDSYRETQSERCTWFRKYILDKWRKK